MDPNATLAELLQLAAKTMTEYDPRNDDIGAPSVDQLRMAELVTQLDDWLGRGGFLPTAWQDSDGFENAAPTAAQVSK